jgi:hypothetical protein
MGFMHINFCVAKSPTAMKWTVEEWMLTSFQWLIAPSAVTWSWFPYYLELAWRMVSFMDPLSCPHSGAIREYDEQYIK